MKYKDITVIVIDHGLQVEFAKKLAEDFNVIYCLPESQPYPNSKLSGIGTGYDFKRVYDYEQYRTDETRDNFIWAFPDVYFGRLQASLKREGRKVYGAGMAEKVELDKVFFLELQEKLGRPVIPYEVVHGFQNLKENLKKQKDIVYLKRSYYRGDFETKKVLSYEHVEQWINDKIGELGKRSETTEIIVQQKCDCIGEFGYDGWNLYGEFTSGLCGPEIKDKGFIGKFFKDIPKALKDTNDAMSPVFKRLKYAGAHSTEVRFGLDGKDHFIDPTCREPSRREK